MSKVDTKEHKEFLKEEKKKDKEIAKERKSVKQSKFVILPVLR
jgi:hypothetical protein